MRAEVRTLDAATLKWLDALILAAGGRQAVAARMAVSRGASQPNQSEIAAQDQRLRRVFRDGRATVKTLGLIAGGLELSLGDLLARSSERPVDRAVATPRRDEETVVRSDDNAVALDWLEPTSPTGLLYRRLNKASEVTANRANVVRDEPGLPVITLAEGLYVRRDLQDEIERALENRVGETPLIIVDGEPGTGKSSLLWSTERALKTIGIEAWLIDAIELVSVFGSARDGGILSETFRHLVRNLSGVGRAPVVLIDTVDVSLNTSGADAYILSLLNELAIEDVTVIAASRPGEARMLSAHKPRTFLLFDYSDAEFPRAVAAYAGAFVHEGGTIAPEAHAEKVLEAAAQGYPIKEICRNPLTLRMLYAIYAPQEINLRDVDVISLYREFWRRRVESDLRTDAKAPVARQTDLSESAMRIAVAMLGAGSPELPRDRLVRELESAGLDRSGLAVLQTRGVIRVSYLGPDHLAGFFHQTFFEHAAALAIIRLGGPEAIAALAKRWAEYDGNLFLGAIIERVLVLSEYELSPVQQEAERVMAALEGPSGRAILAYLFVHRGVVPEALAAEIVERVGKRDTLTVERLLLIGANAVRPRRLALIKTLGVILTSENSRWMRRALELLLRFASPDLVEVGRVIREANLGQLLLKRASKYTQSRVLYLRFLALNYAVDPDWSLAELARYFLDAIKRKSEQSCLDVLEAAATLLAKTPEHARRFEALAGLGRPAVASRVTSDDVARKMGELYRACWQSEGITLEGAISETAEKRGLPMTGRLHALSNILPQSRPEAVARAFELSGNIADATVRIMAARVTWTRCLPEMIERWPAENVAAFTRKARALAGDLFAPKRNGHADILYHVMRHGHFSRALVALLLDRQALAEPGPWLDTRVLGHRLVLASAAGVEGAQAAFAELQRAPLEHQLLTRAALAQLKGAPLNDETQSIALRLATATNNAEAATDILRQIKTFQMQDSSLIEPLKGMAESLRRTGNPKSMRLGSGLVLQLVRLNAAPEFGWAALVERVQSEKDDLSASQLLSALGIVALRDATGRETRLRWLLDFTKKKDVYSRLAVLEIFSALSENDSQVASAAIEDLFELAFKEETNGNLIDKLQSPLFSVYRTGDPRAPDLAQALIKRSAHLPQQACHSVCGTFKRVFGLIVERMDERTTDRLLSEVPGLNRSLGRMIVEGVARTGKKGLVGSLKAVAENSATDPEIVTLAGRFLHRELRSSGIEQWPELYELVSPGLGGRA